MIEIRGKFNTAKCFTDEMEELAEAQIRQVCDQAEFAGTKIRIMPDVHAGMGCTIGPTAEIQRIIRPVYNFKAE